MKLTKVQRRFLSSIYEPREPPGAWWSCEGSEWRTAKSLERRGLIEIYQNGSEPLRHFDVRLTPAALNQGDAS